MARAVDATDGAEVGEVGGDEVPTYETLASNARVKLAQMQRALIPGRPMPRGYSNIYRELQSTIDGYERLKAKREDAKAATATSLAKAGTSEARTQLEQDREWARQQRMKDRPEPNAPAPETEQ